MPTTTNMNMVLPTVGVTVDPTWASNLNNALTDRVDVHDHTTGFGVRVPTAGLNINADLSFGSNDAIDLRSIALNNNVATLPSGDIRALYASGGNLYYNNNSGIPVQITDGASLDVGSLALNVWELQELAANLTIPSNASYVFINTSTAAARVITLPSAAGVTAGRYFIIKDKTGSGNVNNITITPAGSDTIDGVASSTSITSAYGSITLVSDGLSGWLTNAALGGFVQLGGDLLGTGTSTTAPRVSGLTGISGLVTMANNTALNTRNSTNSVNVNLAKMNGSNVIKLGDTAFETNVDGTILRLVASTGNTYINSAVDTWIEALNNIEIQSPNDLLVGVINDMNVEVIHNLTQQVNNDINWTVYRDWGATITRDFSTHASRDGYFAFGRNLDMEVQVNANLYANRNITVSCGNNGGGIATANLLMETTPNVGTINMTTSGTDGNITVHATGTGADVSVLAADKLTLSGKVYLPTKAVTTSPYTVDTTTNDYIIFVDSTGGAISINLPAADNGRVLFIQDVGGAANTNNITLVRNGSDTIQGIGANYVMDADFQGVQLAAYSGASWFIIGTQ